VVEDIVPQVVVDVKVSRAQMLCMLGVTSVEWSKSQIIAIFNVDLSDVT
jgi:hypothetical protein